MPVKAWSYAEHGTPLHAVCDMQAKVALMDTSIARSSGAAMAATGEGTEVIAEDCTFFANGRTQAEADGGVVIEGVRPRPLMCGTLQALLRVTELPPEKELLPSPSLADTASRGSGRAAISRFLCANANGSVP